MIRLLAAIALAIVGAATSPFKIVIPCQAPTLRRPAHAAKARSMASLYAQSRVAMNGSPPKFIEDASNVATVIRFHDAHLHSKLSTARVRLAAANTDAERAEVVRRLATVGVDVREGRVRVEIFAPVGSSAVDSARPRAVWR